MDSDQTTGLDQSQLRIGNMEVTPARLMVVDNLLCQLVSVIGNFSDVVVARVTCSVPDDHPKALRLAS